jgi:amidase
MIAVPSADPVGALVPHTLKEPLIGGSSGPLAGTSFMVKDLFALKGRKVSNGSPDFYGHATPARETAPVITRLLEAGASCTGITVCDSSSIACSARTSITARPSMRARRST